MQKNISKIIMFSSLALSILLFALSILEPKLKAISFFFLGVGLAIATFYSFKQHRQAKPERRRGRKSKIDAMLDGDDEVESQGPSFTEKKEEFSGKLIPLALLFFSIVAFVLSIMLITKL